MIQTVSQARRPPGRPASAPRAACLRQHRLGPAVWSAPPPRAAPPRGPFRQTRSQSSNPPCRGPPAPTLRARQVPTTAPSRAKHTRPPKRRHRILQDVCGLGGAVGRQKLAGVGGRRPLEQDGVERRWRCRFQSPLGRVRSSRTAFSKRAAGSTIAKLVGLGLRPTKMLVDAGPTVVEPLSAPAALQPWRRARTTPTTTRTTRRTGTASRSPRASGGSPPRGCAATGSAISANCADSCSTFHHLGLLLLRLPPAFLPFFAPLLPPRCDHLGLILLTP